MQRALLPILLTLLTFAALGVGRGRAQQSFALDGFVPAPAPNDGFSLRGATVPEAGTVGVLVNVGYSNDALVTTRPRAGRIERIALVRHQLTGQLRASVGIYDRALLFAGLDAPLVMTGDPAPDNFQVPGADGTGLGDLSFGARVVLLGSMSIPLRVAVEGRVTLPLARWVDGEQRYRGERAGTFRPMLLLEAPLPGVRVMFNLGVLARRDSQIGRTRLSDTWVYGLGVSAALPSDSLRLHVEGFGSTSFADPGRQGSSTFEALLGLTYKPLSYLRVAVAAGPGLARGVGTPDVRALLRVSYERAPPRPIPPPPPPADADGDGVPDVRDECVYDAEDMDGFEDADGCDDPDNDADGVEDVLDGCPLSPEDLDGTEDSDGCPDPDNDGDGVVDGYDRCPLEAEDLDGFEDQDGCPEAGASLPAQPQGASGFAPSDSPSVSGED